LRDDSARLLKLNFPATAFSLANLHRKAWFEIF